MGCTCHGTPCGCGWVPICDPANPATHTNPTNFGLAFPSVVPPVDPDFIPTPPTNPFDWLPDPRDVVDDEVPTPSCVLSCQARGGTATFCGFDEFIASSPPKKYLKKIWSGPAEICYGYDAIGCGSPPLCPGDYRDAGSESQFCTPPFTIDFDGALTQVLEVSPGVWRYLCTATAIIPPFGAGSPTPVGARIIIGFSNCVGSNINSGSTVDISETCVDATASVNTAFCGGIFLSPSLCFKVGGVEFAGTVDTWNTTQEYSPITCDLTTIDSSIRISGECPPTDVAPTPIPCGSPEGCYSSPLFDITMSATEKFYSGNGCVDVGDTFTNVVGTVQETLSIEDTVQNAKDRASIPAFSPSNCFSDPAFCSDQTAFSFTFRDVQVAAVCSNLLAGVDYLVTISYGRRIYGTSDPFLLYATQDILFTATAEEDTTPFVTVPNADLSYETRPIGSVIGEAA